jgi:hypothetical protein
MLIFSVRPRESGDPGITLLDSRLRGNERSTLLVAPVIDHDGNF